MFHRFAKATRKTYESRRIDNDLSAQAEAGEADAAAALAARERSKTRRHITLGAMACVAAAGIGVAGLKSLDSITGLIKGAVPHEDAAIQINNVLKKVTLPNKTVLVEGTGTGSASVNVRYESKAPVIGSLFNHTLAKLTDMNASAKREGKVQIGTNRGAIALKAQRIRSESTGKPEWTIGAAVDVGKLYSQTAQMKTSQLSSDSDVLSFATEKGVVKRVGWVTEWADANFGNACGQALTPDIPAGVRVFVKDQLENAAQLETSIGHDDEASLLRKLVKRPIDVSFYETSFSGPERLVRREVGIEQVTLPERFIPNSAYLAHQLGKSKDDVHVGIEANNCSFDSHAMKQQVKILSNGQEPKL